MRCVNAWQSRTYLVSALQERDSARLYHTLGQICMTVKLFAASGEIRRERVHKHTVLTAKHATSVTRKATGLASKGTKQALTSGQNQVRDEPRKRVLL